MALDGTMSANEFRAAIESARDAYGDLTVAKWCKVSRSTVGRWARGESIASPLARWPLVSAVIAGTVRDSDGTATAADCEDNPVPLSTSKRGPTGIAHNPNGNK